MRWLHRLASSSISFLILIHLIPIFYSSFVILVVLVTKEAVSSFQEAFALAQEVVEEEVEVEQVVERA